MSEKLNELKKATMASYLSKAGRSLRSGVSLSKSFDDDAGRNLSKIVANHPNVYTGKEKDPGALEKARKDYDTNTKLSNDFARQAKNRIKGIALAGRRLAKEDVEQIDELKRSTVASYLSKAINRHTTNMAQGAALAGAASVVAPGRSMSKGEFEDHLGKKAVRQMDTRPKGMNRALKQLAKEEVESVNEVSRSTIAKVAQARYNQAQKALKDKNYAEYVTKMKKAIKASDATTPKTGWSHEEETQLPSAEPIVEVSAQEKYRQIRESKVRNRKGK